MIKLDLCVRGCVADSVFADNRSHNNSLGLPRVREAKARSTPLAVVGGGPSIKRHIEELRNWPGDIWAVNGAFTWCKQHGIDAVFFTVDPMPYHVEFSPSDRALLADNCDTALVNEWSGAFVKLFQIGIGHIANGPSTASTAPHLGLVTGYVDISFFGCESSWDEATHGYHKPDEELDTISNYGLLVECGGEQFRTAADFVMQAEYLARMIRLAPHVFKDRSGGLLSAMVRNPDWSALAASRTFYDQIMKAVA